MQLQLQYFAALRDLDGPEVIELPEGSTVETLLQKVFQLQPKLKAWDPHLRVASGTEWVSREHAIAPGEVISLMPPVQGG
jgi:molybdopterin converting factor small subunit